MNRKDTIFRQKSVDRVSSPEQLDNYLKVTSPSVWLVLVGIIIILVAAIVWSTYGKLNTYTPVGCVVESNNVYCYVKEEDSSKISKDMNIEFPDKGIEVSIDQIDYAGVNIPDSYAYLQHLVGVTSNDYVIAIYGHCDDMDSGYYPGRIMTESVSPLVFILN